jgi:hypothetical protein
VNDVPEVLSEGQVLLNRFKDQSDRLMTLHRRFVTVRGCIVARPAEALEPGKPERENRPTAFFAGLSLMADANETILAALERDVDELEKLF